MRASHLCILRQIRLCNFPLVHSTTVLIGFERYNSIPDKTDLSTLSGESSINSQHIPKRGNKYLPIKSATKSTITTRSKHTILPSRRPHKHELRIHPHPNTNRTNPNTNRLGNDIPGRDGMTIIEFIRCHHRLRSRQFNRRCHEKNIKHKPISQSVHLSIHRGEQAHII